MPLAAAIPAITTGLGLGSAVSNLIKPAVAATSGYLQGQPQTTTTTSTPQFTPAQQAIQKQESDWLAARLANPEQASGLGPAKTQAIGGVNKTYDSLNERLGRNFAGRGFGQSGALLANGQQSEIARAGDISGLDAKFAGLQSDFNSGLVDQAQRFAFSTPGNTGTYTTPNTSLSDAFYNGAHTYYANPSQAGSSQGGSSPASSFLPYSQARPFSTPPTSPASPYYLPEPPAPSGGGLSTLSTLFGLNQMLKGNPQ